MNIPKPETKEEEERLVKSFLSGMKKLFEEENNWIFLQPLIISAEHCAKCQTCSEACHIYEESGEARALPALVPLGDLPPHLPQVHQGRRPSGCTATST